MTTNQEGLHATVRALTSTTRSYNEDWHALFDADSIAAGTFNERMLAWINATLGTSYTNVNGAMQAFAVDQGFANWASMNTFVTTLAASFLSAYGPYGMVMNFTDDASIKIDDAANTLDYSSQGTISTTTGALLGPGSKLTNSAPSLKFTEQADTYIAGQAHNLYLNSAAPANQSITVLSGGTYAVTITGSVSVTASGAATGTWTAGTNTFTAATGTLTLGSTSGSGTVHVRRTPSVSTYVATTSAAVYDLPYVFSSGVLTGIFPEPAATNLLLRSFNAYSNASWTKNNTTPTDSSVSSPFGALTGSLITHTFTNSHVQQQVTSGTGAHTSSLYVKRGNVDYIWFSIFDSAHRAVWFNLASGTVGTISAGVTASITALNDGWYRITNTYTTGAANPYQSWAFVAADNSTITANGNTGYAVQSQFETGTVATSPIITYGGTGLRAIDTDTSLLNLFPSLGSAYTMYIRYKPASAAVATTGLRLDDTTANEIVSIGNNASGQGIVTVTDGGVPDATTSGTITSSAFHRIAVSVEANNVLLVVNGGAAAQDTGVTLPTLTRMLLGNTSGQLVTQIALFPGARTEAQLQAIGA